MVGSDLANVINESALLAARYGKTVVTMDDLDEAIDRTLPETLGVPASAPLGDSATRSGDLSGMRQGPSSAVDVFNGAIAQDDTDHIIETFDAAVALLKDAAAARPRR